MLDWLTHVAGLGVYTTLHSLRYACLPAPGRCGSVCCGFSCEVQSSTALLMMLLSLLLPSELAACSCVPPPLPSPAPTQGQAGGGHHPHWFIPPSFPPTAALCAPLSRARAAEAAASEWRALCRRARDTRLTGCWCVVVIVGHVCAGAFPVDVQAASGQHYPYEWEVTACGLKVVGAWMSTKSNAFHIINPPCRRRSSLDQGRIINCSSSGGRGRWTWTESRG